MAALDDGMAGSKPTDTMSTTGGIQPQNHGLPTSFQNEIPTDPTPANIRQALSEFGLAEFTDTCLDVGAKYGVNPMLLAQILLAESHDREYFQEIQERSDTVGGLTAVPLLIDLTAKEVALFNPVHSANHIVQPTQKNSITPSFMAAGGASTFVQPVMGDYRITSRFGHRDISEIAGHATHEHPGIDIVPHKDSFDVRAVMPGVVESVQHTKIGDIVTIGHGVDANGNKIETRYVHTANPNVKVGDTVEAGQKIAVIATNVQDHSDWTGPHLHFECRVGGRPTDPEPYLHAGNQKAMDLAKGPAVKVTPIVADTAHALKPDGAPLTHLRDAWDKTGRIDLAHTPAPATPTPKPLPDLAASHIPQPASAPAPTPATPSV